MKKTIKASALLVAGVFALSGCGSSEGNSESTSTETSTASSAPELTVGQDQYTAVELEEALTAVKADQAAEGDVMVDADLRPQLEASSGLDGTVITPEKCVEVLDFENFFGDVQNATLAGLSLTDDEKIIVVSQADASVLDEQVKKNDGVLDGCPEFEIKGEETGLVITGTTERQDVSTDAPSTEAFAVTFAGEGEEFKGLKVAANSGTTSISVIVSEATDMPAAVAKAEETINAVYAELEKK